MYSKLSKGEPPGRPLRALRCVVFGKLFGRLWPLALTSLAARWEKKSKFLNTLLLNPAFEVDPNVLTFPK